MIAYMVTKEKENTGRFYTTLQEAEKQAGYLNDIPDDQVYVVKEVSVGI